MTKGETAKLLAVIAASFPRFEVDDLKVKVWHEMLGDLDYTVASMAVKKIILQNTFAPAISEVRKAALEVMTPESERITAAEAWGMVKRAFSRYSIYREKEALASLPGPVADTVRYMGWRELCMSEEGEIVRAQFLRMYDQVATRRQEDALLPLAMRGEIGKLAAKMDIKPALRLVNGKGGSDLGQEEA